MRNRYRDALHLVDDLQRTNLVLVERIENLTERVKRLQENNARLRDQLPKVVSLDTTGKLDASMMPTGVKPFGVIDAMAKTIDHEAVPIVHCEKCVEMRRRRRELSTYPGMGPDQGYETRLMMAHRAGHPNMSNWRPVSKWETK